MGEGEYKYLGIVWPGTDKFLIGPDIQALDFRAFKLGYDASYELVQMIGARATIEFIEEVNYED